MTSVLFAGLRHFDCGRLLTTATFQGPDLRALGWELFAANRVSRYGEWALWFYDIVLPI
jgi:hypothetical protein